MTNNPNELTIENSVLVLIDHQPLVAIIVDSIDQALLINNVAGACADGEDPRRTDRADHGRRERERPRRPDLQGDQRGVSGDHTDRSRRRRMPGHIRRSAPLSKPPGARNWSWPAS